MAPGPTKMCELQGWVSKTTLPLGPMQVGRLKSFVTKTWPDHKWCILCKTKHFTGIFIFSRKKTIASRGNHISIHAVDYSLQSSPSHQAKCNANKAGNGCCQMHGEGVKQKAKWNAPRGIKCGGGSRAWGRNSLLHGQHW